MRIILSLILVGLIVLIAPAVADVTITRVDGNPTISDVCPSSCCELTKIDPPPTVQGTYSYTITTCEGKTGTLTITTYDYDGTQPRKFDWSSTIPVNCIVVKGGDEALVYVYSPAMTAGEGLQAPVNTKNPNGKIFGISHASFGSPPLQIPEWPFLSVGFVSIFGIVFFIAWHKGRKGDS